MKALITGGSGFIGWHLAQRLIADNHDVYILDIEEPPPRPASVLKAITFRECDICGPNLKYYVSACEPDAIFHLAAQAGVRTANPATDVLTNIYGTVRILELAIECGAKFVFCSSGAVYSCPQRPVCDLDEDFYSRASSYGLSKLAAEQYIRLQCNPSSHPYTILRFSNVYGFQYKPKAVIGNWIQAFHEGKSPVIHGSGIQARDFIYVDDIVEAIVAASKSKESGTYEICTGEQTSIFELYKKLKKLLPFFKDCIQDQYTPEGASGSALNPERAHEDLGWTAKVSLEKGLNRTVEQFETHWERE